MGKKTKAQDSRFMYLLKFQKKGARPGISVKYRRDAHYKTVAELFRMLRGAGYKLSIMKVYG